MHVRAAGGVLWRPGDGGPEVAVVHRPHYDDWSLPKGKLDAGEHPLEGALREVREETGHTATAGPALGTSRYDVPYAGRLVPKAVHWWALECRAGEFAPSREVDALRWLAPDAARGLLTAGRDVAVLDAFGARHGAAGPFVLLRHAHAGRRKDWHGDDAERPLDARGQAQAARLAALLPLHPVTDLLTAPPLRCRQTLAPLAAALGVPLVVEPLLSDEERAARPQEAADLVRGLAPGTVLCSQGDALPALLEALGAVSRPVRKGAARVLWGTRDGGVADDGLDPEERDEAPPRGRDPLR